MKNQTSYRLPFKTLGSLYGVVDQWHKAPGHRGLDFPVKSGSRIRSVSEGIVTGNGWSDVLGHYVIVRDADGIYWGYNHMAKASKLKLDKKIRKGSSVGFVGSTGTASTGPHLHLTASKLPNGNFVGKTLDPLKLIKGE